MAWSGSYMGYLRLPESLFTPLIVAWMRRIVCSKVGVANYILMYSSTDVFVSEDGKHRCTQNQSLWPVYSFLIHFSHSSHHIGACTFILFVV